MSTIRLLIKPALFTFGFCGTCFCGAAIYQYERSRTYRPPLMRRISLMNIDQNRNYISNQFLELRNKVKTWKDRLSTGQKIACVIISANLYVMLCWRVPIFQPMMNKFFNSKFTPLDRKVFLPPMILSCFSHISAIHLAFNMYCLYSFANVATYLLGPEQFVGLYLSAGVVSSFASLALRIATKSAAGSIGASGALFGIVAYVCMKRPDSEILLFFVPLAAGNVIKGAMLFDAVGILARWKFVDHAAHLGGATFGVWYATYGEKLFNQHKRTLIKHYLEYKKKLA